MRLPRKKLAGLVAPPAYRAGGEPIHGAAVESLARAWSLQTQNASPLRRDQECVRNASREHCHAAASERLLATINVDEDLALQHVEGLIHLRVRVEGRGLAFSHDIVEQEERASGLRIGGEPGVYSTTVEPQLLALALATYDRNQRAHCHLDLTFLFHGTLVP